MTNAGCDYCHPRCRDCDDGRTHYISTPNGELVGCGCSGCCDALHGDGPYRREKAR